MVTIVNVDMSEDAAVEAETRNDIKDLIDRVARIETVQTALKEDLRATMSRVDDMASELDNRASPNR